MLLLDTNRYIDFFTHELKLFNVSNNKNLEIVPIHTKDQLISKGLFGVFNSSKKRTKNEKKNRPNSFVRFFGEVRALQLCFEIY